MAAASLSLPCHRKGQGIIFWPSLNLPYKGHGLRGAHMRPRALLFQRIRESRIKRHIPNKALNTFIAFLVGTILLLDVLHCRVVAAGSVHDAGDWTADHRLEQASVRVCRVLYNEKII